MTIDHPPTHSPARASVRTETTLAHVLEALDSLNGLPATRRRDLRSAVKRVAALLGKEPVQCRLDLTAISTRLAAVNPIGAGLSPKRLSNIRSDFLAAVKASGLKPLARQARQMAVRCRAQAIQCRSTNSPAPRST